MKIAVDIVMLPPENIMELAIEENKKLLESGIDDIILDKEKCMPHNSLVMAAIDDEKLPEVRKILNELETKFLPIELKIIGIISGKINNGKEFSFFAIEKTPELQNLHNEVMKKLEPYISFDTTVDMFYQTPPVDKITEDLTNGFPNFAFEKYNPHITIGLLKKDNPPVNLAAPDISFTVSKITICQLGNYDTCRRILA